MAALSHYISVLSTACLVFTNILSASAAFIFPAQGRASLTHYDMPYDYVASCGCVGLSTKYPTAALNALAYASSESYGPQCYRLTLESTPYSPPPPKGNGAFFDESDGSAPSVVVKITDACPLPPKDALAWCSQTAAKPTYNLVNSSVHFDLAYPSIAIRRDFFPTDDGRDYGAWWVRYALVDCQAWAGYNDDQSWGSDWAQQGSACCPLRPHVDPASSSATTRQSIATSYDANANERTCPSYSDQVGSVLSYDEMVAQIPNTANLDSKKEGTVQTNGAWSFFQDAFFWSSAPQDHDRRVDLEDWQALGTPLLLRTA
jgi:hypothetical protein